MDTEFGIILNTKKEQNFIKINVENIFFAENKVIKTGEYKNFEYTKLPKRYVYYENYNTGSNNNSQRSPVYFSPFYRFFPNSCIFFIKRNRIMDTVLIIPH